MFKNSSLKVIITIGLFALIFVSVMKTSCYGGPKGKPMPASTAPKIIYLKMGAKVIKKDSNSQPDTKLIWLNKNSLNNNLILIKGLQNTAPYCGISHVKFAITKPNISYGTTVSYDYWADGTWKNDSSNAFKDSYAFDLATFKWEQAPGITESYKISSSQLNTFLTKINEKDTFTFSTAVSAFGPTTPTIHVPVKFDFTLPLGKIDKNSSSTNYFNKNDIKDGFSGTASDTNGIKNVYLRIYTQNNTHYWYWGGSGWKSTPKAHMPNPNTFLPAVAATEVKKAGTIYNWKYKKMLTGLKDGSIYTIHITPEDLAGNKGDANNAKHKLTFTYAPNAPDNPTEMTAQGIGVDEHGLPDIRGLKSKSWHKPIFPLFYFADSGSLNISVYEIYYSYYPDSGGLYYSFIGPVKPDLSISYRGTKFIPSKNKYRFDLDDLLKTSGQKIPINGIHEISMITKNKAGMPSSEKVMFTLKIDGTPPPTPTPISAATTAQKGIRFTWQAVKDPLSGVQVYVLYLKKPKDSSFNLVDNEIFIVPDGYSNDKKNAYYSTRKTLNLPQGKYEWKVKARDNAWNYSADSAKISFNISLTAPKLTAPAANSKSDSLPSFTWEESKTTNCTIKEYRLIIKDNKSKIVKEEVIPLASAIKARKGSKITWSTTGYFSVGTYSWQVKAIDNFGNSSLSTPQSFSLTKRVDPSISLISPTEGQIITDSSVTFSWKPLTEFKSYDLYIDGSKISPSSSSGSYTHKLADGDHKWQVKSIDSKSKLIASKTRSFKVDTKLPIITPLLPKDKAIKSQTTIEFSWKPSRKEFSKYEVWIDGKMRKATSSEKYSYTLAEGLHNWYVRGRDKKGNLIKSKPQSVTINSIGPKIEAKAGNVSLKDDLVISSTDILDISVTDPNGVDKNSIEILIDKVKIAAKISAKDAGANSVALSSNLSLKEGSHTIKVTAKDTLKKESTVTYTGIKTYSGDVRLLSKPMNYPNPFKPSSGQPTTINYKLSDNADIKIMIFDIGGQMVWQNTYPAGSSGGAVGENEVLWYGKSAASEVLGNGVYLYTVVSGGKLLDRGEIAIFE